MTIFPFLIFMFFAVKVFYIIKFCNFFSDSKYTIVVFSQRTQCFNFRSSLLIKKLSLQKYRVQFIPYKSPQICSLKKTAYTIYIFSQGNYVSQIRRT